MRAVVTGATGFVGSHLVDRLVEEGVDVTCIVRPSSRLGWLRPRAVDLSNASLHDEPGLRATFAAADVVFHVAGLIRANHPSEYRRHNVEATATVARACRDARVRRLVVTSSQAAAGPGIRDRPSTEDDPPNPTSDYGRSKLAAEGEALAVARDVDVTIVRPSTVYGPRDPALLPMFKIVRLGLAPRLPGDPWVSLIDIRDLCECHWLAATTPGVGGRAYFATGGAEPFSTLLRHVARAVGRWAVPVPIPRSGWLAAGAISGVIARISRHARPFDLQKAQDMIRPGWVCSAERAATELGFRAAVAHSRGLAEAADWYRRHNWL